MDENASQDALDIRPNTFMSCDDVRDLLYLYVCDELATSESRTMSEHLSTCQPCREALAEMIQLHAVMAARMPSIPLTYYSVNN